MQVRYRARLHLLYSGDDERCIAQHMHPVGRAARSGDALLSVIREGACFCADKVEERERESSDC